MNPKIHVGSWLWMISVIGPFVAINAYGCGQLEIQNRYLNAGDTVKIRLFPNSISQSRAYRWVYKNRRNRHIVFPSSESSKYDQRFSENKYTLFIKNVQYKDEGTYKVECWYANIYYYSNPVDLKLQLFTTRTPTTTHLEQTTQVVKTSPISLPFSVVVKESTAVDKVNPNDKENNSSVLIVVIITGSVVLVVTAVIVIVIWKRRALKKGYNNNDENAGINGDNVGNDYAVVNDLGALPEHPSSTNKLHIDTDTYYSIDQPPRNNQQTWCAIIQDEYSQVIPKCFRQQSEKQNSGQPLTDNEIEEYAVVMPKSVRARSQCDNKMTNINITNSCDSDEYATVVSKTGRHAASEEWHNSQDVRVAQGNQFSNYLPSSVENHSHCEYSLVIPKTQRLLDIHGIDTAQRKGANQGENKKHEYDTPSPIIRRKVEQNGAPPFGRITTHMRTHSDWSERFTIHRDRPFRHQFLREPVDREFVSSTNRVCRHRLHKEGFSGSKAFPTTTFTETNN